VHEPLPQLLYKIMGDRPKLFLTNLLHIPHGKPPLKVCKAKPSASVTGCRSVLPFAFEKELLGGAISP
jgi:hypothetical protein